MFEKFSEESIRVIMAAQKVSKILGHNFVGSEQLLVGLIENNLSSSAKILNYLGVKLVDVCKKAYSVCGLGAGEVVNEPSFTPQVKLIFENAAKIAENDGIFVKPEHILASICFSEEKCASLNIVIIECIAQKILQELDVRLIEIERLINEKKFDNLPLGNEECKSLDEIFKEIISKKPIIQQLPEQDNSNDINTDKSDNNVMPITWFLIFLLFAYIIYYFFTNFIK